jgi:5-formyltetrahydrofolate cyclo-ligase
LINAKAEKIVLVFEADIVNHVIAEDHDIKMDLIVTENRLIKINN